MSDTDTIDKPAKEKPTAAPKNGVSKTRVTFDQLKAKKRHEQEYEFEIDGQSMSFLYRAVSSMEWDQLVGENPPTAKQRAEAAANGTPSTYNPETFGPALLSKVCIEPAMTARQWAELWNSPEWNKGELSELFWTAVGICNRGLDVNPTGPVSE